MTEGPGAASYRAAGVDYDALDAAKRMAMAKALSTSPLLAATGARALDSSRGEPAFVFELDGRAFAFVVEGLGTKSIVARQVLEGQGINRFGEVAYDTVAAIVNDLCCVGALPLVVNAYFATGSSDWYENRERSNGLMSGWRAACEDAGAVWGGGESPSLSGLVAPGEVELAGSAVGLIPPGRAAILGGRLGPGDEIVFVGSNGLHANGASLARLIAGRVETGYRTQLGSGRTFGEAVLDRSVIYAPLVHALSTADVEVHYLSHITGHGLLKLMRPQRELTYRISRLPRVPEVLEFLVEAAEMAADEAYATFNMGVGFAVYCEAGSGAKVAGLATELGLHAHVAGHVERGPRRVVLEQVGVVYESGALDLNPT